MILFRTTTPVWCLAAALSACAPLASKQTGESRATKTSTVPSAAAKSAEPAVRESRTADAGSARNGADASEMAQSSMLLADRYLAEIGDVQGLSGERFRRALNELNGEKHLDRVQRFRLAVLLLRDEHGDWERALKALEGLADDADPRAGGLIDLLRKSLRMRLDLRQQTARAADLQERIQQIKTLEKDLQQRSEPTKP